MVLAGRDVPVKTQPTYTCDTCGRDLNETHNCEGWALRVKIRVKNRSIPSAGGVVTAMAVCPILNEEIDFCSMKCLKAWAAETKEGVYA